MFDSYGWNRTVCVEMDPEDPGEFLRIELVEFEGVEQYWMFEGTIPENWDGSLVDIFATIIGLSGKREPGTGRMPINLLHSGGWDRERGGMVTSTKSPLADAKVYFLFR